MTTGNLQSPTSTREAMCFRRLAGSSSLMLLVVAGLLSLSLRALAVEPKFTTALDGDTLALGETATLSLTLEGIPPQGTPELPEIPNLRVQGVSQSSQFSVANGQSTSTLTFSYNIAPRSEEHTPEPQ